MSRWFESATYVICVHDFLRGEVSVKVGVMEFEHTSDIMIIFVSFVNFLTLYLSIYRMRMTCYCYVVGICRQHCDICGIV